MFFRSTDENCDMGILNGRTGCSYDCTVLLGWRCDPGGCASVCGDGVLVEGEECDLGKLTILQLLECHSHTVLEEYMS